MIREYNKLIIVTGAGGFIGKSIIKKLITENPSKTLIMAVDKLNHKFLLDEEVKYTDVVIDGPSVTDVNSHINESFDLAYQELNETSSICYMKKDLSKNYDRYDVTFIDTLYLMLENEEISLDLYSTIDIYHCASVVGVDQYRSTDLFMDNININHNIEKLTLLLTNYCKNVTFGFMSTSEVYGDIEIKNAKEFLEPGYYDSFQKYLKPTHFTNPRSSYVNQKMVSELNFLALREKVNVKIFRLFNIIGEDQNPNNGIVAKFLNKFNTGNNHFIVTEDTFRTYTPIDYAVNYITSAMANKISGYVYNVCQEGNIYSSFDLFNILFELQFGCAPKPIEIPLFEYFNKNQKLFARYLSNQKDFEITGTVYKLEANKKEIYLLISKDKKEIIKRNIGKKDHKESFNVFMKDLIIKLRNKNG